MRINRKIEDGLTVWGYGMLRVLASVGKLEMALSDIPQILSDYPIEFSPVGKRIFQSNFLAAFYHDLPAYITLLQKIVDRETEIVVTCFDEVNGKRFFKDVMHKVGYTIHNPTQELMLDIERAVLPSEIKVYENSWQISRASDIALDSVLILNYYLPFLVQYTSLNSQEIKERIKERSGIDLKNFHR